MNTELEELYFQNHTLVEQLLLWGNIKNQFVNEGRELIKDFLYEGNTEEAFDSGFKLLGDIIFICLHVDVMTL